MKEGFLIHSYEAMVEVLNTSNVSNVKGKNLTRITSCQKV